MTNHVERSAVADVVRSWIGTPYRHRASLKTCGCDCLGLLLGVWREMADQMPADIPPYSSVWADPRADETLLLASRRYLVPAKHYSVASVLIFRMRRSSPAKHAGIVVSNRSFVHAYQPHGVIETELSLAWRRRIVGTFDFPFIIDCGGSS